MRYIAVGKLRSLPTCLKHDGGKEISRELVEEGCKITDINTSITTDYSTYRFVIEAEGCTKNRWESFGYKIIEDPLESAKYWIKEAHEHNPLGEDHDHRLQLVINAVKAILEIE